MSAERNPRVRAMAKALKRCNAMLAAGESLQVALIEAYYVGGIDALDFFEKATKPKRGKKS